MWRKSLCIAVFLFAAGQAAALEVNAAECREGAEFIRNAALARGNGMTKEAFVARFDEDIVLLSAMPKHVRWFVYGDEEASMLRNAVLDVFDFPQPAGDHEQQFFTLCLQAIGTDPPARIEPEQPRPDARGDWKRRA